MVFPVVTYGCESWTVKAECQRIAFEKWCWRRLLRVPWTARRSNQSILKEISLGISLEGMMLKLKLQYLGHLTRRVDSLKKTLMLGGIGGCWGHSAESERQWNYPQQSRGLLRRGEPAVHQPSLSGSEKQSGPTWVPSKQFRFIATNSWFI